MNTQATEMVTPLNTDLDDNAHDQAMVDHVAPSAPMPSTVSPLVALLASGQLKPADVEAALDLQKQHDKYEAEKLFNIAIANFRASVTNVTKDSKSHNGLFASLGAISRAVAKPCGDNGLSYYWTQTQDGKYITVTCHLTHSAGHSIQTSMSSMPENSGNKSDMHATASAISYLKRYTVSSLLGIATEDDDGVSASAPKPAPALITDKQESELVDLLDAGDEVDSGFSKRAKAHLGNTFSESDTPLGLAIPAAKFHNVKSTINKSLAAAKAKKEESK